MWKSERKLAEILIRDEVITISYELPRILRILKQLFGIPEQLLYNCANLKLYFKITKILRAQKCGRNTQVTREIKEVNIKN